MTNISMTVAIEKYETLKKAWPIDGRHILASYDDDTIIVYQAYRPEIGNFAITNGFFGGAFSYARMSWIKPNFLWMMFRSGWGTKSGQNVILGLRISRDFFEEVLAGAVASSFEQSHFEDREEWKSAIARSEVRLQWDPDHDPNGRSISRRAIQLGLRGGFLERFGKSEIIEVIDFSEFVAAQYQSLKVAGPSSIKIPAERVYTPKNTFGHAMINAQ